jgi:hypothetical protein
MSFVLRHSGVHRIPRQRIVTTAKRPLSGAGRREDIEMICPTGRAKYFWQKGWTVESALIPLVKFDYWRKSLFVTPERERSELLCIMCT